MFEASNNHMTSACGGFGRLGVNGLGLGGPMGASRKSQLQHPQGSESEASQAIHHARCITVYVRGRNCKLRSDTSRPIPWPHNIARRKLC